MNTLRSIWIGGMVAVLAGCGGATDPRACTALFAYGLSLTVRDSLTGALAPTGTAATAKEGAYTETTINAFPGSGGATFVLAGERAGNYTVSVDAPGYAHWERQSVVVTRDACHVKGVALTVLLQH